MSEEIEKVDSKELPSKISEKTTLGELINLAEPLMEMWTKGQIEQQKQELDHEWRILQVQTQQNKILIIGALGLLFTVLAIAAYLYFINKDSAATNLLQLVVALGGAIFGGYGWANRRKSGKGEKK